MTRTELLALQEALVRALGDRGERPPPGIDPTRLELVADLAQAKRFAKIEAVLPRTCRALGAEFPLLAREFARAHPAEDFRSRADALGFYRFLRRRSRRCGLAVPYLADLAHCELALTTLLVESVRDTPGPDWGVAEGALAIRRAPGVRLRVCRFNVRSLFQADDAIPAPVEEVCTHLAIVADPPLGDPRIIELSATMFRFLCSVRRWRALAEVGDEGTTVLLQQLERSGLVEIAGRPGGAWARR